MTFYNQKVKGQPHCDIILFYRNAFLSVIQCHTSGTESDIVTMDNNIFTVKCTHQGIPSVQCLIIVNCNFSEAIS